MKKLPFLKQLLAVLCCVICFQNIGFSQKKKPIVLFGFQGGMSINKITPPLERVTGMKFGTTYKWTPSYNFGGFISLYFAKRLYIESGVNVISRKSNALPITVSTKSLDNYYDGYKKYTIHFETKFDHELWAIQIPLALHVNIVKKKNFRTNIYAGLALEQTIRYEVKETNSISWQPAIPPQDVLNAASKYIQSNSSKSGPFEEVNKTTYGV